MFCNNLCLKLSRCEIVQIKEGDDRKRFLLLLQFCPEFLKKGNGAYIVYKEKATLELVFQHF